jgi:hypothetical protein
MTILKRYGGFFLLAVAMAGLLASNLFVSADAPTVTTLSIPTTPPLSTTTRGSTSQPVLVYVDIKGEVRMPGVYGVSQGVRLYEVILLAGGLTTEADVSLLNQAITVYDAMVVVIPRKIGTEPGSSKEMITVEIKGEVLRPGSYRVEIGTTLQELILQAGGLTIYADVSSRSRFPECSFPACRF